MPKLLLYGEISIAVKEIHIGAEYLLKSLCNYIKVDFNSKVAKMQQSVRKIHIFSSDFFLFFFYKTQSNHIEKPGIKESNRSVK